jgi:hypothetical protein
LAAPVVQVRFEKVVALVLAKLSTQVFSDGFQCQDAVHTGTLA